METSLELALRAGNPLIWLSSPEEDRSVPRVQAVVEKLKYAAFEWDCISGFKQLSGGTLRQPGDGQCTNVDQALNAAGEYKQHRAVFLFKDVQPLARRMEQQPEYVALCRRLNAVYHALKKSGNAVVFLSCTPVMPAELTDVLALVEADLPDHAERLAIVTGWLRSHSEEFPCEIDEEEIHRLVSTAAGMTSRQIQSAMAMSVVKRKGLFAEAVDDVLDEKVKAVKASEVLEFVPLEQTFDNIGGLAGIKDWLRKRSLAFGRAAAEYRLRPPKGVVLVGPPGTGKSLLAKAAASGLQMALVRFDVGKVQGPLVGQSEERMRMALALAEILAPVVMWMDEIDKGFAGVRGPSGDSGTTQRNFGQFLSWMQERPKPVFILATANSIRDLPPEFLRKGRFDEIFFVDLPTFAERAAILDVLLRKYGRDPTSLISDSLVNRLDRFSGAEIEHIIRDGMYEAFYDDQRALTGQDLETAAGRIVPLADQRRDEIEEMRRWGKANARPAS